METNNEHRAKFLQDDDNSPLIYHVGPIVNFEKGEPTADNKKSDEATMSWLDSQPCSSQEKEKMQLPKDYEDYEEVFPEGFLERTSGIGKVVGWTPQVTILSHPAVGGFVSHFGWNSTLESIWCGVPIAAWPIYAEQQTNAFQLVKELGLAVEIKLDYRKEFMATEASVLVTAEEREGYKMSDG